MGLVTQIDSATGKPTDQESTGKAANAHIKSTNVASDADRYLNTEGVTALAAATTADSGDISGYKGGTFISSLTGTLTITGSIDGVNFSTVPLRVYNESTNPKASIAATALAAGTYSFDRDSFNWKKLRFAAATNTVTVVMGLKP